MLVSTSTVFIGDHPNYGTDVYWMDGPPAKAMMDTSGIGDSLPLTTLSLDTALLQWGLFPSALDKIGFYFDTFIFQNGTIDMGHWKDIWSVPSAVHASAMESCFLRCCTRRDIDTVRVCTMFVCPFALLKLCKHSSFSVLLFWVW